MKRTSGGSKNQPSGVSTGATPLQINIEDAERLVGGIVEKGFTDVPQIRPLRPPVAPRPSLFPFPVARHRSAGPHWHPKATDSDDFHWEANEEEDFEGMELFAGAANPLQRKEKKGLDFNRWKEIVRRDGNSGQQASGKGRQLSRQSDKNAEIDYDNSSSRKAELDYAKLVCAPNGHMNGKDSPVIEVREKKESISEMHCSQKPDDSWHWENANKFKSLQSPKNGISKAGEHGLAVGAEDGLESDIDAENCARLAKMSTSEIAEAQDEIMSLLKPDIINALRKRGQNKIKRQKFVLSGSQADAAQHEKNTTDESGDIQSHRAGTEQHRKIAADDLSDDKVKDKSDTVSRGTIFESRGIWDVWSRRVEHVRHLRFSLDGNIISSLASDIGNTTSESGKNVENVTERDFLRSEGDPGASGYTIKEAVTLARSVVPGQRALALNLIAAILNRAIFNILRCSVSSDSDVGNSVDGEAIWAYCLGPEPELALALRLCLDDNHNSVVLACTKAIQLALTCDMNDTFFDILDRTPSSGSNPCTSPVFRSKPGPNLGFLRGGFWKYNTKPSNFVPHDVEPMGGEHESERTIQDDIVVTVQDFAAGLVRMGILPRINYLLEKDPAAPLEEGLISILIAIARHSPRCAAAVMEVEQLVQTIARRFATTEKMEIKIKSVVLIKVLAQHEKNNCLMFMKNGIFRQVTWQLHRHPLSLDQWMKSGAQACTFFSDLMVEQLRLWKVFIHHGFCISEFASLLPSLCSWLVIPTAEKLVDLEVMNAYYAITREAYLLLDVSACKLPNFYPREHPHDEDENVWSWSDVGPIIDLVLEWMNIKSIPDLLKTADGQFCDPPGSAVDSLIWVISSVLSMLSSVLKALTRGDPEHSSNIGLPWLPEFVPKIGLAIAGNGVLSFSGGAEAVSNTGTVLKYFYQSRFEGRSEFALSTTCCLQGLLQVAASVDKIIQSSNLKIHNEPSCFEDLSVEDRILASGMLKSFSGKARNLQTSLLILIDSDWHSMQNVEMFGRGGPSPGVGVGWGASGGGYWSVNHLLAQQDAGLLCCLLEALEIPVEVEYTMKMLSGALKAFLIVSPGNASVTERLLKFICQAPILKLLASAIHRFRPLRWTYEEDEYLKMANLLSEHFTKRWLGVKNRKSAAGAIEKSVKKGRHSLHTIHEDLPEITDSNPKPTSLTVEWASQRLPIPTHWFLSSITSMISDASLEVAKSGLFFLLGLEAISTFDPFSPVKSVPVVWKLHAMSALLLSGMGVLADEKTRAVYSSLQDVYGELIDEMRSNRGASLLPFKSLIHESYSTFVETLVEQFAAESYGDVLFGKQIAVYLHASVEASVRLAAWNALFSSLALELLPPLDSCLASPAGYFDPSEEDESILEVYAKSWVSGALDKAERRSSLGFCVPLHHLSSFIFGDSKPALRSKLARSLLKDCSLKRHHEGMVVKLICYGGTKAASVSMDETERRLRVLREFGQGSFWRGLRPL